jgi:hypothetical protein
MLQNPIYRGDFKGLGKVHRGSRTPLLSHETFAHAHAVLQHNPRGRNQKHRHPVMGLLRGVNDFCRAADLIVPHTPPSGKFCRPFVRNLI